MTLRAVALFSDKKSCRPKEPLEDLNLVCVGQNIIQTAFRGNCWLNLKGNMGVDNGNKQGRQW
jgi:hypothetical protein